MTEMTFWFDVIGTYPIKFFWLKIVWPGSKFHLGLGGSYADILFQIIEYFYSYKRLLSLCWIQNLWPFLWIIFVFLTIFVQQIFKLSTKWNNFPKKNQHYFYYLKSIINFDLKICHTCFFYVEKKLINCYSQIGKKIKKRNN